MKKLVIALAVASVTTSALAANFIRMPAPKLIGDLSSHPAVPGFSAMPGPKPETPVAPPKGSLDSLSFSSLQAGATLDLDAVLRNTGEVPLELNVAPGSASLTGSSAFSFLSTSCAATLPAAESCLISVRFTAPAAAFDIAGVLHLDTSAGELTASLIGTSASGPITYKLGAPGASSRSGGDTTFSYSGLSANAGGGKAGGLVGARGLGGVGVGGTARVAGGFGGTNPMMGGSGGGGGIGGGNAGAALGLDGGTGGNALDFGGLQAAVAAAGLNYSGPGLGKVFAECGNCSLGQDAFGFGAGGGGVTYQSGVGGRGLFGGGGAGSTGNWGKNPGGTGGQGVIVVLFRDGKAELLMSGSSYTPTKAIKRIWAIGAGGGGGASAQHAEVNGAMGGGGGGAGAIVYQDY